MFLWRESNADATDAEALSSQLIAMDGSSEVGNLPTNLGCICFARVVTSSRRLRFAPVACSVGCFPDPEGNSLWATPARRSGNGERQAMGRRPKPLGAKPELSGRSCTGIRASWHYWNGSKLVKTWSPGPPCSLTIRGNIGQPRVIS